jgi:hypothetical protein
MLNHDALTKKWIIFGIISGLMVSFIYPTLMFIPLPEIDESSKWIWN